MAGKVVDVRRREVEERPEESMCRYRTQSAHAQTLIHACQAPQYRLGIVRIGTCNEDAEDRRFASHAGQIRQSRPTSNESMERLEDASPPFARQGTLLNLCLDTGDD